MRILALALTLPLAACAGGSLGYATGPAATMQRDVAQCRDIATHAGGAKETALETALGATIIGYPIALARSTDVQRKAWATCMTDRGYVYSLADPRAK